MLRTVQGSCSPTFDPVWLQARKELTDNGRLADGQRTVTP